MHDEPSIELMHVLQISAAPSVTALTADLAAVAQATLQDHGHQVTTVDLMAIDWNPVVTAADYGLAEFTAPVGTHAADAAARDTLSPVVREHQRLLADADLVVFTFPLWWGGMPAILKGWVDRVFTDGFAYGLRDASDNPRKFGDGAFSGKRGLIITTAGERSSSFEGRGINGCIDDLLFPVTHGVFWYTGIAPLKSVTLLGIDSPVWKGIDDARSQVRQRLSEIDDASAIPYRRMLEDYDEKRLLHSDIAGGRSDLGVHVRSA